MEIAYDKITLLRDGHTGNIMFPFFDSAVSAGFPSPAADYMQEEIDLNQYLRPRPMASFIIRVKGDSMKDAHIPDGSLLIVDRSIKPATNKIVLAVLNGELVLKRLVKTNLGISLVPANAKYAPLAITDDMDFRVWGTVTQIIINAFTV